MSWILLLLFLLGAIPSARSNRWAQSISDSSCAFAPSFGNRAFHPGVHLPGRILALPLATTIRQASCIRQEKKDDSESTDKDNGDKSTDDNKKNVNTMNSQEIYEKEQEASRKVMDKLLFPNRLNRAFTATAWAFIIFGFVLNLFGYDYLVKDGKFTIDTLENTQFENEIRRTMKKKNDNPTDAAREGIVSPATTRARVEGEGEVLQSPLIEKE